MSRLVVAIAHVEFTIANQTLYVVKVQQDLDEWEVRRTYTDFRTLRDDVARVLKRELATDHADASSQRFAAASHALPFPAKRLFGSRSNRVVRARAVELHQFLIQLLLLTHTYRKAQKQLYDAPALSQSHPSHQLDRASSTSTTTHPQASVSVFFLLRDFLKPTASTKTGANRSSTAHGHDNRTTTGDGSTRSDDDDSDSVMRRMIRESKMLAMRSSARFSSSHSSQQSNGAMKSMSAPNVLAYSSDDGDDRSAYAATAAATLLRQQSSIPILEELPARKRSGTSGSATLNKTLNSRTQRTDSHPDARTSQATNNERFRAVSNATAATTPQAIAQPRNESAPADVYIHGSAPSSLTASAASASTRAYAPAAAAVPAPPVSSNTALTIDNTLANARMFANCFEDSDSDHAVTSTAARPKTAITTLSSSAYVLDHRRMKTPTPTKKSTNERTKTRSVSAREARTSERKSKLSPQLAAQAVTLSAQRELEERVSEYSAIMVLRYIDRFISKAASRAPGCYTVNSQTRRLVIDSERFVEELDTTFKDLPTDFATHFQHALTGDWCFPPELDAYVQMKWKSFQAPLSSSTSAKSSTSTASTTSSSTATGSSGGGAKSSSRKTRRSRRAAAARDASDSDETEYEYEETTVIGGGGYMKAKNVFTDEVVDVLDQMISDGTAGRDQMLRLRRQKNEMGWDRRAHPSGVTSEHSNKLKYKSSTTLSGETEYWTDTDDDDHRGGHTSSSAGYGGDDSGERRSTAVEHYQQKYNALRKERLSRREGGLV